MAQSASVAPAQAACIGNVCGFGSWELVLAFILLLVPLVKHPLESRRRTRCGAADRTEVLQYEVKAP